MTACNNIRDPLLKREHVIDLFLKGEHVIDLCGTKCWYNDKGQYHRLDGPAYMGSNGSKAWFINGKRHRVDSPAIISAEGLQWWFLDGNGLVGINEWIEDNNLIVPFDEPTQMLFLMKFG